MRPEVVYAAPLNVRISGKFEWLGPTNCHVPGAGLPTRLPIDIALTCLKLAIAFMVAVIGTSFAGYARWA
jgi:hypothetical protein